MTDEQMTYFAAIDQMWNQMTDEQIEDQGIMMTTKGVRLLLNRIHELEMENLLLEEALSDDW